MRIAAIWLGLGLCAGVYGRLEAQQPADSATFVMLKGSDTVSVERVGRDATEFNGVLTLPIKDHERMRYRVTTLPDATAPLLEVSVWRGTDAEGTPARQMTRVIFKEDSVAVDDATNGGFKTLVFPTERGAVPYLNVSSAFLEQATLRAHRLGKDSLEIPFFNLSGGQTAHGTMIRTAPDSAELKLGQVEFRLRVAADGHLLGGTVPSQGITIVRVN